jgi:hypothetical protein
VLCCCDPVSSQIVAKSKDFFNGLKNPTEKTFPVGFFHPLEIFLFGCGSSALGKENNNGKSQKHNDRRHSNPIFCHHAAIKHRTCSQRPTLVAIRPSPCALRIRSGTGFGRKEAKQLDRHPNSLLLAGHQIGRRRNWWLLLPPSRK